MKKCLLTELGRAGRENIWLLVMAYVTLSLRLSFYYLNQKNSTE